MEAASRIEIVGTLELIHFRGGKQIDRRFFGPKAPTTLKRGGLLQKLFGGWFGDPHLMAALKSQMFDPGLYAAMNMMRRAPQGLITSAGINYTATDFASGQASPHVGAFNYHAFGTGQNSGGTHTPGTATNATPIVVTDTAHGYTANDIIDIASYTGNTGANGIWQISPVTTNTYTLLGSVGNGSSGGSPTSQRLNGAGDTALVTDSGVARVTGVQSNPAGNQYRSVATMTFASSLAIVEWGLFSASSSGTLWDRRWFNTSQAPQVTASTALTAAPINVNNGDSIQATYTATFNAGGS